MMMLKLLSAAAVATFAMTGVSNAQQQQLPAITQQTATIKRTPLQKFDVPGTNYETVIGIAEIVPDVNIGRHTHPGPESGFILEGEMILMIGGCEPDCGGCQQAAVAPGFGLEEGSCSSSREPGHEGVSRNPR
jgi:hypothetical protein